MSYKECKDAKRLFRRVHRQIVDPYLLKVQNDIDKLAEIGNGIFGAKLISAERNLHQNQG